MARREPFDPEKDEVTAVLGSVPLGEDGKAELFVTIRSYDGGPEKVSIQKRGTDPTKKQWSNGNIGRLTDEEANALGDVLIGRRYRAGI